MQKIEFFESILITLYLIEIEIGKKMEKNNLPTIKEVETTNIADINASTKTKLFRFNKNKILKIFL